MSQQSGMLARAWSRLFGSRDPIERQLNAVAKEGEGLARVAHGSAVAMLVLFSAGSLVALAGDSVAAIASGHVTIPAAIAAGVSALLVLAMDVSMVYAASQLRLLAVRRQSAGSGLHRVVLIAVAVLEAATYAYMSWRYEQPGDGVAWALIVARALAAPLLSVYLSLARALPVTGRDILQLAERLAAEGVLRDIAHIAADPAATLADKLAIYGPVAVNAPDDDARLVRLFEAAQLRAGVMGSNPSLGMPLSASEEPTRPPTGPGSPMSASKRPRAASAPSNAHRLLALPAPQSERPSAVERIYSYLDAHPKASIRTIERRCGVASSTASKHRALWLQERSGRAVQ
jgi:hypothetical protein